MEKMHRKMEGIKTLIEQLRKDYPMETDAFPGFL